MRRDGRSWDGKLVKESSSTMSSHFIFTQFISRGKEGFYDLSWSPFSQYSHMYISLFVINFIILSSLSSPIIFLTDFEKDLMASFPFKLSWTWWRNLTFNHHLDITKTALLITPYSHKIMNMVTFETDIYHLMIILSNLSLTLEW